MSDTTIDGVKQELAALDVIANELNHFYSMTSSETDSLKIYNQILMLGDIQFAKRKELDALEAAGDSSALTEAQKQELQDVLDQLHRYVRNDQTTQMCISYVLQIADRLK
jgi:hypothetical protein